MGIGLTCWKVLNWVDPQIFFYVKRIKWILRIVTLIGFVKNLDAKVQSLAFIIFIAFILVYI